MDNQPQTPAQQLENIVAQVRERTAGVEFDPHVTWDEETLHRAETRQAMQESWERLRESIRRDKALTAMQSAQDECGEDWPE